MATSAALREYFEIFSECGVKHAFRLRSGTEFLGWVVEVKDSSVGVVEALNALVYPARATDDAEKIRISFDDIEIESLGYYDEGRNRWVDFPYG
jgi:hypothetical protein